VIAIKCPHCTDQILFSLLDSGFYDFSSDDLSLGPLPVDVSSCRCIIDYDGFSIRFDIALLDTGGISEIVVDSMGVMACQCTGCILLLQFVTVFSVEFLHLGIYDHSTVRLSTIVLIIVLVIILCLVEFRVGF